MNSQESEDAHSICPDCDTQCVAIWDIEFIIEIDGKLPWHRIQYNTADFVMKPQPYFVNTFDPENFDLFFGGQEAVNLYKDRRV